MWDYFAMWNTWGRIGMIGGIIGMLIGAIAAIAAAPIFGTLFTLIMVSILFFTFRSTMQPGVEAMRLARDGEDGTATILQINETGWTINNMYYLVKFQLEVHPKQGPAYRTEIKSMISRLTMAQFQPGAVVPVRYDPKNLKRVALTETTEVDDGPAAQATAAPAQMSPDQIKIVEETLLKRDALNKKLLAEGEAAEAVILRCWPMGIMIDGANPMMGFMLEIHPNGKAAFTAETEAPIKASSIYKYQAGNKVFVKFDPNDTSKVTLDHSPIP
ncbi:MAG TPA: DUF3592 domain-containing protein [Candidatus Omnitrophota bacterium]|nr:DUF3592 domain-containing protein [Candidatus Omnitrophota bacterium]